MIYWVSDTLVSNSMILQVVCVVYAEALIPVYYVNRNFNATTLVQAHS